MSRFKDVYIFSALGLILGLWFDKLYYADNLRVICYLFPALFGCIFAIAYNNKNTLRLLLSSFVVTGFLTLPILPFSFGEEPANINHLICFLFGYPVFIYIGHCYHYAYHQQSSFKIDYKLLFAAVWNTIPLIVLSFLFVASSQIIFILGAYVYKSVNNPFLWDWYFGERHFRIISNSIFFFIGLCVCKQNIAVIYSLRLIIIKAFYYLFPFIVLISMSYFFFIFSNTMFYKESIPVNLDVLIPLIILGIIFFNAYIQDIDDNSSMPESYNIFIKFYRIVLFAITLMLANTVLEMYTFDVNICVYLISGLALTAIYFLTIFLPKQFEFSYIRKGNVYVSLFFVISLLILNIPYHPVVLTLNS